LSIETRDPVLGVIAADAHAYTILVDVRIVPRRPRRIDADKPPAPMSWMQRLKRVFAIDIETCLECGGKLRVIACIEDPPLIATILEHVRWREALIGNTPRSPPVLQAELTLT